MLSHPLLPNDGADDTARDVTFEVIAGDTAGEGSGTHGYTSCPRALLSQRGRLLPPAYREERRAYVAPFFAYCERRAIISLRIARRAALRMGEGMTRQKLHSIKQGALRAPHWFIAEVCRELGQPLEVVMGAEWAQRHLSAPAPDLPAGERLGGHQSQRPAGGQRLSDGLGGGLGDGLGDGSDEGLGRQQRAS